MDKVVNKLVNKYTVLIGSALAMLAIGIHYVWSIFQPQVITYFGINSGAASLTFYLFIALNVTGIIIGGRICDRVGPRIPTIIGAIIYIAGLFLSSLVPQNTFWLLYITYSGLVSFGGGFVYTCAVSCAQKWWPEKKGFASGFVVCMLGASTLVLTPIINSLIAGNSLGLMATFRVLGIAFFILLLIALPFLRFPENTNITDERNKNKAQRREFTFKILKSKSYYLLLICLMIAPFSYYTINPLMKMLGIDRGLSETVVVTMVMMTGIASAAGRLLFGKVCDNIGSRNVLTIILSISLICILCLSFARGAFFYVLVTLLTCAYGGTAGITPVLAIDYYGNENTGTSFGMLMVAVLVSSLFSSVIINAFATPEGHLTLWNFIVPAIIACAGIVIARINNGEDKSTVQKNYSSK